MKFGKGQFFKGLPEPGWMNILGIFVDNRGVNSGMSKLTEDNVLAIKESELKHKDLAKLYNVNQSQISRVKSGKRWGHLLCLR